MSLIIRMLILTIIVLTASAPSNAIAMPPWNANYSDYFNICFPGCYGQPGGLGCDCHIADPIIVR